MKVSNLNIPISEKNNPRFIPKTGERTTSGGVACRDPFILVYGGRYYLYRGTGKGVVCSVSDDLEHWSDAVTVFDKPENFHGVRDLFWAPECHYFRGHFYIFTSVFSSLINHRCVSVYRADNPLGPFEDIAGGRITPEDWDAIDGTLYVDGDGDPWLVFVHEWTSMPEGNGAMAAARLSDDFTHLISEPIQLFRAKDPSWAVKGVTDGPYLYTTDKGSLLMIWSNFGANGYVVACARSASGNIEGPWTHESELVYEKDLRPEFTFDGGHAMIFADVNGKTKMTLHSPNKAQGDTVEHVVIFDLKEENDRIVIA